MSDSVLRLPVRRFSRPELAELARWEAVSSRHGWSVGDGAMSPVEFDDDGVEYVSLYLAAVTGGPVYFVKPGVGVWSLLDGRGEARPCHTLRAALEYVCPTYACSEATRPAGAMRPASADRRPGAVVVRLPTAVSHLTLVR